MKLKITILSLTFFSFLYYYGCNEEKPVEPEPTIQDTIIAENTTQVDSSTFTSNLVAIDSTKIVYSSGNSFTQSLVVGGFIVSDYEEGILRKIVSIESQGGQIVVGTRPARFDEVIIKGKIEYSEVINLDKINISPSYNDKIKICKLNDQTYISFNNIQFGTNQEVEIDAGTKFINPRLVVKIEWDHGEKGFEIYLEVTNESFIEINTSGSVIISGSVYPAFAELPPIPIPTPLIIPIYARIKFGVGCEVDINQASFSRIDSEIDSKIGVSSNGVIADVQPTFDVNTNMGEELDYLKGSIIIPKVGLYFLGALGVYFEQSLYAKLDMGQDNTGKYVSVNGGGEAKGGFESDFLGLINIGKEFDIYNDEVELWRKQTTFGWIQSNSGTTEHLLAVSAVDENIVWASSSNGTVLKTINGGRSWQNVGGGIINGTIWNLFAWDHQLAFCSNGTSVFRTTDGGNNWSEVLSGRQFINSIWMKTRDYGYCFGDPNGGYWDLLSTTDGGTTWNPLNPLLAIEGEFGVNNSLYVSGDDIYFGTMYHHKIYHSSDGGYSWTSQSTPNQLSAYIWFDNDQTGMEGGDDLAKTTDGGNTWNIISHPHIGGMKGIASKGNNWWYGSGGVIFYSSDSGANWAIQYDAINTMQLTRARNVDRYYTIWAVGADGKIARYLEQ